MLAIINILLIVGILLFILYNIYVDTRNWSNTGSFIEGMDNNEEIVPVSVEPQQSSEQQTDSIGAGSAETAGNVAPMGSNVPQNCKTGCVAPTGPNGNCKVIQKDGVEKRECYYGCPTPTFERGDTVNCAYDKDCNSCGTVLFNPDAQPNMPGERPGGYCPPGQDCDPKKGHPDAQPNMPGERPGGYCPPGQDCDPKKGHPGEMMVDYPNDPNSRVGNRIDVPGIQNAPGLNPGEQTVTQGQQQMVQGQMNQPGSTPTTVSASNNSLFNENIMKQVLKNRDLIPGDINSNNEEQSFNLRVGKNFMINTATIRNFALPNIENQDYIELGRIVKKIKMREKDPRDIDQVKALYSKLNVFVLELLTDSSLDMSSYDNSGMPNQLNNKTRTTGMFGENSNSLLKNSNTYREPGSFRQCRGKIKCYDSIWGLN
jgi:hypothetical protein